MSKLVRHTAPRDIPNNFILNENSSMFSFILPEYGENLYYHGEGWQFIGDSSEYLYSNSDTLFHPQHGYVDTNSGEIMYNEIYEGLEPDTAYTFSFWCKRAPGSLPSTIEFYIGDTVTQIPASFTPRFSYKEVSVNDYWCAYALTFYTQNALPNKTYHFVVEFPDGGEFFFDGFQLEQKPYRSTYISGDLSYLKNQDNYYWTGVPHNSISVREASVNSGRIVSFNNIGFNLIEAEGFGLPDFEHSLVELPVNPTQLYQGSIPQQRDISLNFNIYSKDLPNLLEARKKLIQQLKSGMLHLQVQLFNCHEPISTVFETTLLYDGGAELNLESFYGEQLSLDFTTYDPYLYKIGIGAELLSPVVTGIADFAVKRNGVWGSISTPKNGQWSKLIVGSNSTLYALYRNPEFEAAFLYKYDIKNDVWTPLLYSGDLSQAFFDMILIGDELYVCGQFGKVLAPGQVVSLVGPRANLFKYNINTQQLTHIFYGSNSHGGIGGPDPYIYKLTLLDNNKLLVVGDFGSMYGPKGTIGATCAAMVDINTLDMYAVFPSGTTFSAGSRIYAAMNTGQNSILLGGQFTINGHNNLILLNNINNPNILTRNVFAAGAPNGPIFSMAKAPNGDIYVGGTFSNANTGQLAATQNVGNYNSGATPVSIGKMVNNFNNIHGLENGSILNFDGNNVGTPFELSIDNNNILHVVGYFNYYGRLEMNGFNGTDSTLLSAIYSSNAFARNASSYARYNILNKQWEPPTILYNSDGQIFDVLVSSTELYRLYGIDTIIPRNGSYKANNEVVLTIPNDASPSYPNISIISPQPVYIRGLENTTYNTRLYFNRVLNINEQFTIELRDLLPIIKSSIYGVLNGQLLFGSNPKTFIMYSGHNQLKLDIALESIINNESPILIVIYDKKYLSIDSIVEGDVNEY